MYDRKTSPGRYLPPSRTLLARTPVLASRHHVRYVPVEIRSCVVKRAAQTAVSALVRAPVG